MVVRHQVQTFLFAESQPLFGIRGDGGIIGALDVEVLILVIRLVENIR